MRNVFYVCYTYDLVRRLRTAESPECTAESQRSETSHMSVAGTHFDQQMALWLNLHKVEALTWRKKIIKKNKRHG